MRKVARARPNALRHRFDFRFQQDDVRRLARDVAGAAHGDAEVGLFQGRRVVDAIAHERHALALLLKLLHKLRLLFGPHLGKYVFFG